MFLLRTSRSTGLGVGPLGLAIFAIGGVLYAALLAICTAAVLLFVAAKWGGEWAMERRRLRSEAAPHPAPGVEPWARGHREISATERAIMAQSARR